MEQSQNFQFVKVALVQATPALFDLPGCLHLVKRWTQKAAEAGAQLVVFPEAFIPCYPRGLSFGTVVGSRSAAGREVWEKYFRHTIERGDAYYQKLADIAKTYRVFLVIGITERERGTLYCSLAYFGPEGQEWGLHRKLKPTAAERIIWGEGVGDDLQVHPTAIGKLGGLICWENYMPLARFALYQQEVELYLAPTADHRESWQASMRHIACEGRCFVLACNQFVRKSDYPKPLQEELTTQPEIMSRGGSVIVSPLGDVLAGPLWDQEGLVIAELDRHEIVRAKMDFDATGHYHRPDVFGFQYPKSE
jgi:nitrilase